MGMLPLFFWKRFDPVRKQTMDAMTTSNMAIANTDTLCFHLSAFSLSTFTMPFDLSLRRQYFLRVLELSIHCRRRLSRSHVSGDLIRVQDVSDQGDCLAASSDRPAAR